MEFDLKCEGFCFDDSLKARLLLTVRRAMVAAGWSRPLFASVRLIDGRVQARLELLLPGRRVIAVVWRDDPVEAMERAVDALVATAFGGPESKVAEGPRTDLLSASLTELAS